MVASDTLFSSDFLVKLFGVLPMGVGVLDAVRDESGEVVDFTWIAANREAFAITRRSERDLIGFRLLELFPTLAGTSTFERYRSVLRTGEGTRFEQPLPGERGSDRWYEVSAFPLDGFLAVTFQDITQRKSRQEQIYTMAFRDVLTGLYNRRYFLARAPSLIALARRKGWRVAMLYFDLNGFKSVNDTHGHAMGDRLLQGVAWRMKDVCRQEAILFRSGGDEFGLFMIDADEVAAKVVAERMAGRFGRPFGIDGVPHRIGAAIGVAVMPSEEATVGALLERADRAMYDAKARKGEADSPVVLWDASRAAGER